MAALGNCAPEKVSQATASPPPPSRPAVTPTVPPTVPPSPVPTMSPTAAPTPVPGPTGSRTLLRNDNVPGFYVRYYRPFEAVDPDRWILAVDGLVREPQELSLPDVMALPRVSQTSRLKCVECWSAAAKWEGFHLSALMELVDPEPTAKWVHFFCADDYFESQTIEALLGERVLFVHHMNEVVLPAIYGAPLRLMVPFLYGYKSAKAITHLAFAEEELPGHWPTFGPYSTHGTISKGGDRPLDLEGTRTIPGGGEIFYPDGIEWQDKGQD